jgi:hypothetical protein
MKRILSLWGFIFVISSNSFAQFVQTNPNSLSLPQVSALPGCAAADYGKMVFLTTTNKANVCSGSGWVEVSAGGSGGGLTLPYSGTLSSTTSPFVVTNTGGGSNSAGITGSTTSALAAANGVWGIASNTAPTGANYGVQGFNQSTNTFGYGVYGRHAGGGIGLYGYSATGTGVYGTSGGSGAGISGFSNQANGTGVYGYATNATAYGVWGKASFTSGIAGYFSHDDGPNGWALVTDGKVQFRNMSGGVDRILVCTDSYGTAVWASSVRNDILKLGPAAFQSHISTNESSIGGQGISMTTAAGSFIADVNLPDGAKITGFTVYYIDNDGAAPNIGLGLSSYALQKMAHTGTGAYSNITNGSGSFTNTVGSPNITSVTTLPLTENINNATHFYRFVVSMPASVNLVLSGVAINYQYSVLN